MKTENRPLIGTSYLEVSSVLDKGKDLIGVRYRAIGGRLGRENSDYRENILLDHKLAFLQVHSVQGSGNRERIVF